MYEGKTNDLLITFIGYVNDLNKWKQFKVIVQKSHHRLYCTFQPSWQQQCVALLWSSRRSCFMTAALSIMRATNSSLVFTFSLQTSLFIHPNRPKSKICTRQLQTSNSCISTPTENWTHVCMNLFTRNSPYYHLLKCLLFFLLHPVYIYIYIYIFIFIFKYPIRLIFNIKINHQQSNCI